jgi:hypothetical protein
MIKGRSLDLPTMCTICSQSMERDLQWAHNHRYMSVRLLVMIGVLNMYIARWSSQPWQLNSHMPAAAPLLYAAGHLIVMVYKRDVTPFNIQPEKRHVYDKNVHVYNQRNNLVTFLRK